ncbi:MAG: T9SS type A sorting domain-containing protein [Chitinophagales bacterium]|nr:T9SS type A sorting domain-containing protein [Chitinophagales bacterium]
MRKLYTLLAIAFLLSCQLAFSQVAKKIVVEHFTNTNCSVCASRNPGFYTNLNSQAGVLHLAVHPSAPYSSCLLYQQNSTANDARTNYYGIYGGTPRLVINGVVISSSADYSSSSIFTPYQSLTSPASILIVQQKFGTDSVRATVIIKTEAPHALGDLSLFVALAEDTVFYTGTNGEDQHYDVFRKSLSSTTGTSVALPAAVGDSIMLTFSSPSNSIWNFSRIYTLAILQETSSKNLVQAEAVSPSADVAATGINENIKQITASIFPNPVDNLFTIQLGESSDAIITLTDIDGKLIMQQAVSQSQFQFDISSLPKATYLLNIKTEKGEFSQKIIKR